MRQRLERERGAGWLWLATAAPMAIGITEPRAIVEEAEARGVADGWAAERERQATRARPVVESVALEEDAAAKRLALTVIDRAREATAEMVKEVVTHAKAQPGWQAAAAQNAEGPSSGARLHTTRFAVSGRQELFLGSLEESTEAGGSDSQPEQARKRCMRPSLAPSGPEEVRRTRGLDSALAVPREEEGADEPDVGATGHAMLWRETRVGSEGRVDVEEEAMAAAVARAVDGSGRGGGGDGGCDGSDSGSSGECGGNGSDGGGSGGGGGGGAVWTDSSSVGHCAGR